MRHVDPYLPAEALGLSEEQRRILIEVAHDLSVGAVHFFGMGHWRSCICGQMEKRGAFIPRNPANPRPIHYLFTPGVVPLPDQRQAARACYNFLRTAKPHWREAMRSPVAAE